MQWFIRRGAIPGVIVTSLIGTSASAALLTGDVNTAPSNPANLTTEGALDWAMWGTIESGTASSMAVLNHKSGGPAIFSSITAATSGNVRGGITSSQGFTWTDGTTTATGTNVTNSGLIFDSNLDTVGEGVRFTVGASNTTERQVKIWGALNNASGTFTASLPGATDVVLSSQVVTGGTKLPVLFTINYQADAPDNVLTVKFVLNTDNGTNAHVGFQAAAVSNVPEPTFACIGMGVVGLLAIRRRKAAR